MLKSLLFLLLLFNIPVFADKPITPKDYHDILKVGIDVNWAMFKKEIEYFSKKEVEDFKRVGFSHVRIRIRSDVDRLKMSKNGYIKYLKRVVDTTLKYGLIPILAYDAKDFKKDPTESNLNNVVKYWSEIGKEFRHYTHKLSFDIIIEPGKKLNKNYKILNKLYEKTVYSIRELDPKRIVFIAPIRCSSPFYLKYLKIPSRSNGYLMVEWHFYAAGPSKTNPKRLWTRGTKEEKRLITVKIKSALKWQKEHNIMGWVGAWMPSDYNHGNHYTIEEQIKFATFMSNSLKSNKIPFAINADQKFYNYRKKRWIRKRYNLLLSIVKNSKDDNKIVF